MRASKRNLLNCAFAATAAIFSAQAAANASTLIYTFTGNGSGTIGGVAFTNANFTVTFTQNTTGITNLSPGYNEYSNIGGTFVEGANNLTISNATVETNGNASTGQGSYETVFLFNSTFGSSIGISDDATLLGYALATPIDTGAVTGAQIGAFQDATGFSTSGGTVQFTSLNSLEFSAALPSSAPEPSTLGMLGMGIFGAVLVRRRAS